MRGIEQVLFACKLQRPDPPHTQHCKRQKNPGCLNVSLNQYHDVTPTIISKIPPGSSLPPATTGLVASNTPAKRMGTMTRPLFAFSTLLTVPLADRDRAATGRRKQIKREKWVREDSCHSAEESEIWKGKGGREKGHARLERSYCLSSGQYTAYTRHVTLPISLTVSPGTTPEPLFIRSISVLKSGLIIAVGI